MEKYVMNISKWILSEMDKAQKKGKKGLPFDNFDNAAPHYAICNAPATMCIYVQRKDFLFCDSDSIFPEWNSPDIERFIRSTSCPVEMTEYTQEKTINFKKIKVRIFKDSMKAEYYVAEDLLKQIVNVANPVFGKLQFYADKMRMYVGYGESIDTFIPLAMVCQIVKN